jgi:hypothetical protein
MNDRDDWIKTRSRGNHLTEAEKVFIKEQFVRGRRSRDVARELQCSSRIVSKYYGFFRAQGVPIGARRAPAPEANPLPPRSRFYRSSFELEAGTASEPPIRIASESQGKSVGDSTEKVVGAAGFEPAVTPWNR